MSARFIGFEISFGSTPLNTSLYISLKTLMLTARAMLSVDWSPLLESRLRDWAKLLAETRLNWLFRLPREALRSPQDIMSLVILKLYFISNVQIKKNLVNVNFLGLLGGGAARVASVDVSFFRVVFPDG